MSRRYVCRLNDAGEPETIELGAEEATARLEISTDSHYEGLRATDGADIGSRVKHREYMRQNGLTTADDYTEHWAKAKKRRAEFFSGGGDQAAHRERQETIGRVMYELEKRSRK